MYDYYESVKESCEDYINERINEISGLTPEEAFEALYDDAFVDDSVTGNASGSFTFNAYKAEQNLVGNKELLREALLEFCCDPYEYMFDKGAEACDVTIRCYLLGSCLMESLKEMEREYNNED